MRVAGKESPGAVVGTAGPGPGHQGVAAPRSQSCLGGTCYWSPSHSVSLPKITDGSQEANGLLGKQK